MIDVEISHFATAGAYISPTLLRAILHDSAYFAIAPASRRLLMRRGWGHFIRRGFHAAFSTAPMMMMRRCRLPSASEAARQCHSSIRAFIELRAPRRPPPSRILSYAPAIAAYAPPARFCRCRAQAAAACFADGRRAG